MGVRSEMQRSIGSRDQSPLQGSLAGIWCAMCWRRYRKLNNFVIGMAHLLAPEGIITIEVPHLERLITESSIPSTMSTFRTSRWAA